MACDINGRLVCNIASISGPAGGVAARFPVRDLRQHAHQVLTEGRRVGEVEVELQQIAQPHRLPPERFDPVTVDAVGGQATVRNRTLQERVDDAVAVERGLVLVLFGDVPTPARGRCRSGSPGDRRQRVQRRAVPSSVRSRRTLAHRNPVALEEIQRSPAG